MQVAGTVAVLFLVVLAGAIARRIGIMTDAVIHGTSRLVTEITLPCLTVYSMTQREFSAELLRDFLLTLALSFVLILLAIGLGWFLFQKSERSRRVILSCFCGLSNCGFMGYPVIMAINPDWMIYAVAFNISYGLIAWTLCVSLFAGDRRLNLKRALLNVNIIASAAGMALFCLNVRDLGLFGDALNMIGGLTTPLSMLLIGTRITTFRPKDLRDMDTHWAVLLRNLALPLATYGILLLLPVAAEIRTVIFILTAMPLGTLTSMLAELHRADTAFAARTVAWSTLLSLGTIPLMLLLV